jgi:hypothetical protein
MKSLLLLLVGFYSFSTLYSQKNYVWDYYQIQITVPDDFRVKKNDNHDFEMKGDGMDLAMHIFEENISIDELSEATIHGAKAARLTEVDEATEVRVNELEGYYVEGFKDGFRVIFAGLGNPSTQTNFFLVITFSDDDKEAEKAAFEIINSLDVLQ